MKNLYKPTLESKAKLGAVGLIVYAVFYQMLYQGDISVGLTTFLTGVTLFGLRDAI